MFQAYGQEHPASGHWRNDGASDVAIGLADAEKPKRVNEAARGFCAR